MWSNISSNLRRRSSDSIGLKQQVKKKGLNDADSCCSSRGKQDEDELSKSSTDRLGSPLMRYKHAVCSASSGYIYIHGGRIGSSVLDEDVWRFDPHQNSWLRLETRGAKPPSLQEHTLVEYSERLYLFGGQVSASMNENSFWQLDLVSKEWQSLSIRSSKLGAHLGPANRRGHTAVVYGASMYVYGGFEDFRGSSGQLWEFHLINERWELRDLSATSACKPEPRHNHSAVVHEHSMYIYGGLSNLKPLGDLWRWSWKERRWFKEHTRGHSPGQLHGHSAITAFGSMFVFGGERVNGRTTRGLWRLNLSNLSWTKIRPKGPRPSASTWHGAIANPLNILDEANYIIEGADLLHNDSGSSINDQPSSLAQLSFGRSSQIFTETASQQQQSLVETSMCSRTSIKNSTSEHYSTKEANSNMGSLPYNSKRTSRLNFLKRRRCQERTCSSYQLKHLASDSNSVSASVVVPLNDEKQLTPSSSTYSITHHEICSTPRAEGLNVKILESLDTDIKLMFERALSPNCEARVAQSIDIRKAQAELQQEFKPISEESSVSLDHSQAQSATPTNLTTLSRYVSARQDRSSVTLKTCRNHDDEFVSSQRTSYAFTTPPSEMNYTTSLSPRARELKLSSTVSSVNQPLTSHSTLRSDNRPRSEIVHSLIERADARIKHLYTPFFGQPNSVQEAKAKRYSFNEKNKRHTLPQTMTYYNLFFDEESNIGKQQLELDRNIHESKSILQLKQMSQPEIDNPNIQVLSSTTGGALSNVYDSADTRTSRASELSLELNSSDSKTLCGAEPMGSSVLPFTNLDTSITEKSSTSSPPVLSVPSALTLKRETLESCDNTSLSFSIIAEFEEDDILQYSSSTEENLHAMMIGDNVPAQKTVGLSLDKRRPQQQSHYDTESAVLIKNSLASHLNNENSQDNKCMTDSNNKNEVLGSCQEQITNALKSASSGYDSISGYEQNSEKIEQKLYEERHDYSFTNNRNSFVHLDTESSLAGYCNSLNNETSPKQETNKHFLKSQDITSSTNTSLAFASINSTSSRECFASNQNVQTTQSQQVNQVLVTTDQATSAQIQIKLPLKSRLFGSQKLKTRYWQLCMFVIGGKQVGTNSSNEPITIWRLYI